MLALTPEQQSARREAFKGIREKLRDLIDDSTFKRIEEIIKLPEGQVKSLAMTDREWRLLRTALNVYIERYME